MDVFTIAPAGTRPLWMFVPIVLIVLGVIALLAVSIAGSRTSTFTVSSDGLRIRGDLYGRTIPLDQLQAHAARRVDLRTVTELRPTLRTWGTGLPGYQSGWFRLANGERALLYLTDRSKAVHIPTTQGYGLLLSPNDPDAFVSALTARAMK